MIVVPKLISPLRKETGPFESKLGDEKSCSR